MTTNDNLDHLGARIYGRDTAGEADNRGGRVYGHNDVMDDLGARVYGLGDRGAVSHQQATVDDTTTERWGHDKVRHDGVPHNDDLDAIGARIEARRNGRSGVVAADNRNIQGNNTPGLAGFDY